MFVLVECKLKLLVLSQEKEKSFFKGSSRFSVFLHHPAWDPRTGEQWRKEETPAKSRVFVLLPTLGHTLWGSASHSRSCLVSRTAEVREPCCPVWQCRIGGHQRLLVDDCLQPHLDCLTQEGSLPWPAGAEGRKFLNIGECTCYGRQILIYRLYLAIPKWERKACAWRHLFFLCHWREIWASMLIIGTKSPGRLSVNNNYWMALFLFSENRLQVRAHLQSGFNSVPLAMGFVILASPGPLIAVSSSGKRG